MKYDNFASQCGPRHPLQVAHNSTYLIGVKKHSAIYRGYDCISGAHFVVHQDKNQTPAKLEHVLATGKVTFWINIWESHLTNKGGVL